MAKVKALNLEKTVMKLLDEYGEEIGKDVARGIETVSPQVLNKIQSASPKRTGDYAKGWRVETNTDGKGRVTSLIYNETDWQLTHLLENGHANRNGGKTKGKKHIAPTQKWAEKELYEEVVKNIND